MIYWPFRFKVESVEQRRTKRFSLQLPLAVTRAGAERLSTSGLTRNISSSGVLFLSEERADLGGSIEYVITLAGAVNIRCVGKVVRCSEDPEPQDMPHYQVAATLERYEFVRR